MGNTGTEGATRKGGKSPDGTAKGPRHGNRPRQEETRNAAAQQQARPPGERKSPEGRTPPAERKPAGSNGGRRPDRTEKPDRTSGDRGTPSDRGGGNNSGTSPAERSLYDGGSPSANRLGPAKAMRARDVSRPAG